MTIAHRIRLTAAVLAGATLLIGGTGCSRQDNPVVVQPAAAPAAASSPAETADIDVTTGVKTALLRDEGLKAFDIGVVTTKGDVRLTGQVDNQAQIDSALAIARGVTGVHSIHDELVLKTL